MHYEFLFMRASGDQLRLITALVDEGALRPIVGRVVLFDHTIQALQNLEKSGSCGKTVISNPAFLRTRYAHPPQPVGRREWNKQQKVDRITAAAREFFAEHGVDNVTTQQIADQADIGAGTLFLYAKTKGELPSSSRTPVTPMRS